MSKYGHVMFDCECLSLRPRAVVLSIGAVAFDLRHGVLSRPFYAVLNRREQQGRETDPETLLWWEKQAPEARQVLLQSEVGMPLGSVMKLLWGWIREKTEDGWCAWSNGADFDLPLLVDLFAELDLRPFWFYRDTRCMRTLKQLFPEAYERAMVRYPVESLHNAGADALWQAQVTRDVLREVNAARALTEVMMTPLTDDDRKERLNDSVTALLLARAGLPK